MKVMEIKFKRDTSFRKQFFVPESFAHPAKMDAQLLIWLVEHYTQPGEVILDPMAGMGTTMLACTLGRDVILVELEEKFCKMCKSNWERVRAMPQLGYEVGQCNIVQGDARQLQGLLVDKIVTSPPFADEAHLRGHTEKFKKDFEDRHGKGYGDKPFKARVSDSKGQIGNLPYGQIDKIVTSPPFAGQSGGKGEASSTPINAKYPGLFERHLGGNKGGLSDNPQQIDNLPYGNIDSIITSPPYEESIANETPNRRKGYWEGSGGYQSGRGTGTYGENQGNIGNLKSQSYLEAMLQVYQQCHKVLKPQGLMILVTKNFIRDKQVVRLDEDTIKLCEEAGFSFLERHYRVLTSMSFWRIIYHQKHPEVEKIEHEDVLVFSKHSMKSDWAATQ